MNGFGFIEYEDAMDARDVVPGMALRILYSHKILPHLFGLTISLAFRMYHLVDKIMKSYLQIYHDRW